MLRNLQPFSRRISAFGATVGQKDKIEALFFDWTAREVSYVCDLKHDEHADQ